MKLRSTSYLSLLQNKIKVAPDPDLDPDYSNFAKVCRPPHDEVTHQTFKANLTNFWPRRQLKVDSLIKFQSSTRSGSLEFHEHL